MRGVPWCESGEKGRFEDIREEVGSSTRLRREVVSFGLPNTGNDLVYRGSVQE